MTIFLEVLSVSMLTGFIWAVTFLLPRALREQDRFAVICSLLVAIIALLGWLLIGTGTQSR